jgi:toxin ParE1/3/4
VKSARYHPAARRELRGAIEHDEEELPGRGLRLEEQVARVLLRLRRLPLSAPIWNGLDSAHEVRRAFVRRHPYLVVYMVHPDQLIILAVAYTKKKPGYWASRIDDAPPAAPRRTKRKPARSRSRAATGERRYRANLAAKIGRRFSPRFLPRPASPRREPGEYQEVEGQFVDVESLVGERNGASYKSRERERERNAPPMLRSKGPPPTSSSTRRRVSETRGPPAMTAITTRRGYGGQPDRSVPVRPRRARLAPCTPARRSPGTHARGAGARARRPS